MMARGRARRARQAGPTGQAGAPAFDLAAIQAALAPDEAVIYHYWLSRTTLLIVTLDRAAVIVEKTDFGRGGRAWLDSLLAQLDGISQLDKFSYVAAIGQLEERIKQDRDQGLLARLLPDAGRELLAGKTRLVLSPHGVLHQVPLHAFPLLSQREPLIKTYAVRYVPSLTSLLLPFQPPGRQRVLIAATADLPQMTAEASAIADIYGKAGIAGECLPEGLATAERLNGRGHDGGLGDFSTLHLAVHGFDPPAAEPFEAGLWLADRKLDGLEISRWRLQADLVVLAACHSARRAVTGRADPVGEKTAGEELFGDEVFGLQAAFFGAGARQVLGAMWPIQDDVAAGAMVAFHRQLAASATADIALRDAVVPLVDAGYFFYQWASFKLTSLGSRH
jgi:hypothetical protein